MRFYFLIRGGDLTPKSPDGFLHVRSRFGGWKPRMKTGLFYRRGSFVILSYDAVCKGANIEIWLKNDPRRTCVMPLSALMTKIKIVLSRPSPPAIINPNVMYSQPWLWKKMNEFFLRTFRSTLVIGFICKGDQ